MEKYYRPPVFKGRDLQLIQQSKGKKHYWGQRGKSYGFYTSNDEEQMVRGNSHQRIKSEFSNYREIFLSDLNTPKHNSLRKMPLESIQREQRVKTEQSITQMQGKNEGNPQTYNFDLKERLKVQLMRNQEKQLRLLPRNIDINLSLKNMAVRLPQIQRSVHKSTREQIFREQKIKGEEKSVAIAYYSKQDHAYNPTFCNSPKYPLPCYRYIP